MKIILLALFFLLAPDVILAQTLSKEERMFVIELLEANAATFLSHIEKLSDDQWKFKPSPDGWSVGEVSEHITLAEGLLFSIIQKTLQGPADEEKAKVLEGKEKQLLVGLRDRSFKAQAPEIIKPSGKFATRKELAAAFKTARDKTINYVKTTNDPLKNHVAPHPAFGEITTYQWLVLIAGHADRHVAQLEEVKSNGNFPKI